MVDSTHPRQSKAMESAKHHRNQTAMQTTVYQLVEFLFSESYPILTDLINDSGRGSFTWSSGHWTNVRQTVFLNTPGKPDGSFTLDVNGARILNVDNIYYRNSHPISVTSIPIAGPVAQQPVDIVNAILRRQVTVDSPAADATGPSKDPFMAAAEFDNLLGSLATDVSPIMDSMPESSRHKFDDNPIDEGMDNSLEGDWSEVLSAPKDSQIVVDGAGNTSMKTPGRKQSKDLTNVVVKEVTATPAAHTVVLPPLLPEVTKTVLLPSASAAAAALAALSSKSDDASERDPVGFVGIFFR